MHSKKGLKPLIGGKIECRVPLHRALHLLIAQNSESNALPACRKESLPVHGWLRPQRRSSETVGWGFGVGLRGCEAWH